MCFLWVLKNSELSFLKQWWNEMSMNRLARILEVLYLAVSNFEYKVSCCCRIYWILVVYMWERREGGGEVGSKGREDVSV